jgi:hypothetical protein
METPQDPGLPPWARAKMEALLENMQDPEVAAGIDRGFRADPSEYQDIVDAAQEEPQDE